MQRIRWFVMYKSNAVVKIYIKNVLSSFHTYVFPWRDKYACAHWVTGLLLSLCSEDILCVAVERPKLCPALLFAHFRSNLMIRDGSASWGRGVKCKVVSLPTYPYKVQPLVHTLMLSGSSRGASILVELCLSHIYLQQRGIRQKWGKNERDSKGRNGAKMRETVRAEVGQKLERQ
jgi:hypothetical protein